MNPKLKDYLGVAIIIVIFILAYAALVFVSAYSHSSEGVAARSFSVTAQGKAVAAPDIARFDFSVIDQGGVNIDVIKTANDKKTAAITAFLKQQGVEAADIRSISYNLEPRYQYYNCNVTSSITPCPPPAIVGYTITSSYEVKVRNFAKINGILTGVAVKGAGSISQLFFDVDDPAKPQNKARMEAITKAKEQALVIAKAGGFRLGQILSIEESYGNVLRMGGEPVTAPPTPSIEPGSQEIIFNVVIRYEIR